MTTIRDPLAQLPEETNLHIFSYLDAQALEACFKVSSGWRNMASDESLWVRFFPETPMPQELSAKHDAYIYGVKSIDEVIERIQEFASRVRLNQEGVFDCTFPSNAGCSIEVTLKCGNLNEYEEPNLRAHCIFIGRLPSGAVSSSGESDTREDGFEGAKLTPYHRFTGSRFFYRVTLPNTLPEFGALRARISNVIEPRRDRLTNEANALISDYHDSVCAMTQLL